MTFEFLIQAASYSSTYGYDYGLLFDKMDGDRSGSINIDEFSALVKRFCPEMTERQLRNLMKAADEVRQFLRICYVFSFTFNSS